MNEFLLKEQYPLSRACHGIGIVIVNIFRGFGKAYRDGAGYEIEKLSEIFDLMGLEVRTHQEKTNDEIVNILLDVSREIRLKTDSMIAIAISSHGCEEGILGINIQNRIEWQEKDKGPYTGQEDSLSQDCIKTIFNGKNCSALSKKPKIIIFNGCRGGGKEELIESNIIPTGEVATTWSDFFIINSCQPGMESLRSNKMGSLFIDKFLSTYKDWGADLPFEMLLPIVNRELMDACDRENTDGMHCCNWESSCTSFLKITPTTKSARKELPAPFPEESLKLVWATATKGTQGPNQMSTPHGLTITPSGQIYIIDQAARCIWVYSADGEPIYQEIKPKEYKQLVIENLGLKYAWGACVFENFLFASCSPAIIKISLLAGGLLTHKMNSSPTTGLDIDTMGMIYMCERLSCNVVLLDLDLIIKDKISLTSSLNPGKDRLMDIKVLGKEMYVLVNNNDYTIQIFDVKGAHLKNLVSKDDLHDSLFFTINRTNRYIYAGDLETNELKAFDEHGEMLYKTGQQGAKRGSIATPRGIDLTAQGEVVIVCLDKKEFMLQSFQVNM